MTEETRAFWLMTHVVLCGVGCILIGIGAWMTPFAVGRAMAYVGGQLFLFSTVSILVLTSRLWDRLVTRGRKRPKTHGEDPMKKKVLGWVFMACGVVLICLWGPYFIKVVTIAEPSHREGAGIYGAGFVLFIGGILILAGVRRLLRRGVPGT